MNNKFDELTKSMAQSLTRRAALKKFGVGLAGIALASLGLKNTVHADTTKPFLCCTYRCLSTDSHTFGRVCVAGTVCPSQVCIGGQLKSQRTVDDCAHCNEI